MYGYNITSFNLNDAWYKTLKAVLANGLLYEIAKGSTDAGHYRIEVPYINGEILNPSDRPLHILLPSRISDVPAPSGADSLRNYFNCLMDWSPQGRADYHYGEFLGPQIYEAIDMFVRYYREKGSFATNRVEMVTRSPDTLYVYKREEHGIEAHTPCLTNVGVKIREINGEWVLFIDCHFRSWDMWDGFPMNLGGLILVAEEIISEITHKLSNEVAIHMGSLFYSSSGAHIYDMKMDWAKQVVI